MLRNPTKAEILALNPVRVERKDDNSGTYVINAEERDIAFISNSYSADGIWLYYSSDVREWLGLETPK